MSLHDASILPLFSSHVAHDAGAPIVDVRNLCVNYKGNIALDDISFQLTRGETIAVVGPNGAGKSTLFKVLAGLLDPARGEVKIFGHGPVGHFCIAYVVQRSAVDWSFPVTVYDVVMMGRTREIGLFRRASKKDHDFVRQCLDLVGIGDLATRRINELSGGQQQRMFIARALAQEAALMLMDEPFNGLDMTTQEGLLKLIDDLGKRRVTIMVATHDLGIAAEHFDRVMLLNHKLVGLDVPKKLFTPEKIVAAFGGAARPVQTSAGPMLIQDECCGGHDAPV
jgi:ABC-type Mn2+/Zn2+ transport system ATPase subunit